MAIGQLAETVVLAEDIGELVGWAGVNQPDGLLLQVDPLGPDAAGELTQWLTATADGPDLSVEIFTGSTAAIEAVSNAGFDPSVTSANYYGHQHVGLQAVVDDVKATLPTGYSVRSVRPGETEARIEVHRASWRPADLPFNEAHRPFMDPSWTSSFYAEQYAAVRSTWLYRPEFDLVVVAPDGSLAGCCVVWFDPWSGWGEIEPLGVVPGHRGRGLAGALCAESARRVRDLSGCHVHINTGLSVEYPAPYGAYVKAEFVDHVRSETYSRTT